MWCEWLIGGFFVINLWTFVASDCEVSLQRGYAVLGYRTVQAQGLLQTTPQGYPFCSYLGIPYAKPPVGELRFELSQPIHLSLDAKSFDLRYKSPICVQNAIFTDKVGQEDCLYLNVYTKPSYWGHLKPVLVWFHGGYGHSGSAYSDGADRVGYLVDEDVVVVTFNYRLGMLGFLYRNKDNFPGNLGMRDQVQALKWIQTHISSFGGDPRKVTLMGWNSGSTYIGYFLQAPALRGLFHGAIMLSGSPFSPWAYERSTEACVNVICDALNVPCARGDLKFILKNFPTSTFASNYVNTLASISYFGEIHPCFVPTFAGNDPAALVQDKQMNLPHKTIANDVPLIISHTVAENWKYYVVSESTLSKPWNYSFVNMRNDIITPLRRYLISGIKELNNRSAKLMIPATMVNGIKRFTDYYTSNAKSKVYFYRLSYKNVGNTVGAYHGDDLRYIFGPHDGRTTSAEDSIRMRMVRYITNFAKSGNPTPKLDSIIMNWWKPYTISGLRMDISSESRMIRDMKDETYRLWESILQCLEYNICKKFYQLTSEW